MGSNDEVFWFWVRREEPPALYYCRHDQFATSLVRRQLPIDPGLLVEALGINEINPALPQQGPYRHSEGRFSIHTIRETPEGPQTKVTVVEARRGVVLEQSIYDAERRLVASAVTRSHRVDPLSGLTVPRVVDINCPRAELNLRIDLGNVEVNRPLSGTAEVFAMPQYQGYPLVNLCDPRLYQQPPTARTSMRSGRGY